MKNIKNIVFDLGGVLIDWNPKYLYRKIFDSEEEIDYFLREVCDFDWNELQDAGRSLDEATKVLLDKHPKFEKEIIAYYGRWSEMLGGVIDGSLEVFNQLKDSGRYKFFILSNWSAETYPIAHALYPVLSRFDGEIISGREKLKKPDPKIYQLLEEKFDILLSESIFIDDSARNVKAANEQGLYSILFKNSKALHNELISLELL